MNMDIAAVWHEAGERVKDKYMIPTLWRALENSVAITLEDGQFVVGLGPGSTHLAGHLNAPEIFASTPVRHSRAFGFAAWGGLAPASPYTHCQSSVDFPTECSCARPSVGSV